jgi:D-arabinose 1-dehydrogenase-like Zn-dependent alcohol dehydrogenase
MKALVKARREPGLWLDDVPEPEHGINDVLIRVRKTGIWGTDLHIHRSDGWAQRTIPVPMVVGHKFVGEPGRCSFAEAAADKRPGTASGVSARRRSSGDSAPGERQAAEKG